MSEIPRIAVAAPPAPDAALVETLRGLLAQAEAGELGGIAYIGYAVDRNIVYGICGPEMGGQNARTYFLLHWLANRAMARWETRQDVVPNAPE